MWHFFVLVLSFRQSINIPLESLSRVLMEVKDTTSNFSIGSKFSQFGASFGYAVWFCHVLFLDESELPFEIRVSTKNLLSRTLEEILQCFIQMLFTTATELTLSSEGIEDCPVCIEFCGQPDGSMFRLCTTVIALSKIKRKVNPLA